MTGSEPAPKSSAVRAYRSPRAWTIFLLVFLVCLAADLSSKYWTFANVADDPVQLDREQLLADPQYHPIPPHHGVPILPAKLLNLHLVINRGAVFGIGDGMRYFFIAFTLAALCVGVFIFGRYCTSRTYLAIVGLALILAGGAGNLYDRIVYGVVRDFLHMLPGRTLPFGWKWPQWFGGSAELFPWVFNLADVMLLTGMGMLLLHLHKLEQHRKHAADQAEHTPNDDARPT